MAMTKKERLQVAIHGDRPDQLPYAFWTHMPKIDRDPALMAERTYKFYKTYDMDFIKTMNNGMYAVEDFGCAVDYSEIATGGVAKLLSTPIKSVKDWKSLNPGAIGKGALARELRYLKLILKKVRDEEVPVLFTIFSPLTIANKLSKGYLMEHITSGYGKYVKVALDIISETTADLTQEALNIGADGIFFASQMSTYDIMTTSQYLEYGKPYDLKVLEAASTGWMNTLHCHGQNIMFELLKDYPVQVFNWHIWETLPDLDEAYDLTRKCLMGGLNRADITRCNRNAIRNQIYRSLKTLRGRHQILTPGCAIRYPLDEAMLAYIKKAKFVVEKLF